MHKVHLSVSKVLKAKLSKVLKAKLLKAKAKVLKAWKPPLFNHDNYVLG